MASSGCSVEKSKTLQGLLSPFSVPSTWTPFLCPGLPPSPHPTFGGRPPSPPGTDSLPASWAGRGGGGVAAVVGAPGLQCRCEARGLARAAVGLSTPSHFWHVIWGIVPGWVWPLDLVLWLSLSICDTLNSL